MQVILPYRAKNVTTTNIPIFTETPYLNKSMEKDQMLNIYMKDEFPLLIVANDRILLKAPHIGA